MSKQHSKNPVRAQVIEEAAGWLVEFRAGDPDGLQREAFDTWLRASPEHVQAYIELLPLWENSAGLDPQRQGDAQTLIEWARAGNLNVFALPAAALTSTSVAKSDSATAPPSALSLPARLRLDSRRAAFFAAAAVVCTAMGGLLWFAASRGSIYQTEVGEQRSIVLADGSTVELNARTRVRIRFTQAERGIDLLAGQALFRVAQERNRPFIVHSGLAQVRAVGTQFDVYRKADETTVTVVEGRVAVSPDATPASTSATAGENTASQGSQSVAGLVFLSAGERVSVSPQSTARPTPANVAVATAWTQRRLIFSATPLSEVAEEFNRYNTRPLVVEDPRLQDLQINGIFSSTNPQALLRFLREQPGIAVTVTEEEVRVTVP